jgi:hypothetical protein
LAAAEYIAPGKCVRQRCGLDWERVGDAASAEGLNEAWREAKGGK